MRTRQKSFIKRSVIRNRFSYISRLSAALLLIILLSQPVTPIFAMELTDTPPPAEEDTNSIGTSTHVPVSDTEPLAESPAEVPVVEEVADEPDTLVGESVPVVENVDDVANQSGVDESQPDISSTTNEVTDELASTTTDETQVITETITPDESVAESEEVVSDEVVDETPIPPADDTVALQTIEDVEQIDSSSSTLEAEIPTPALEETNATTGEAVVIDPVPEGIPPPSETIFYGSVVNNTNRFSFTVDECVPMGSETFFCSKQNQQSTNGEVTGVLSMLSSQGNKEIFIVTDDATNVQITDNVYDDEAPYYDAVSNTIVWHRSIDGRYQIVEHSMDESEERVLTNGDYNSMYPSRYGDTIVWQGWVGENWEIFLEDSGDTTMITENSIQDVAPRINDNYVIWQAFEDGIWKVKVYDRISKQTETVADSDGTSAQNPRFVLVYDAKHENGDVETRGYDLVERTNVPLNSMPAPLPKDLPAPEQTGEERALVNQTPQVKNKLEASSDNSNDPNSNASSTDSTVVDENVLIVPPYEASTTPEVLADESDTEVSTTTSESLIEEEVISTSTSTPITTEIISELDQFDIIVTPFVPSVIEPTEESI